MKNLSSYLSAGIAATATFQSSDAATVVTFYGSGAQNPSSTPATPLGINIGKLSANWELDTTISKYSTFLTSNGVTFTQGLDHVSGGTAANAATTRYTYYGKFSRGAQSGSANYVSISFNGDDGLHEAVGQFSFDGMGGGYLVAIAKNDDNTALSISAGKLAIDAAAVPEPSAIALLALGAGGMAMRRNRKVA